MVHGACCQGNHVLCLYMSRPVASFGNNQTIRSKEIENANYDAHVASEKLQCHYPATKPTEVFTLIMNFF